MLQPDRAGRLHVLQERAQIKPVEVVRKLEADVQLHTTLEGRVYRLDHPPVLVAAQRGRLAAAVGTFVAS